MGLVIIGVLAVYLLISIAVVICAIKHAKNNGKSAKRWGWSAALVMYLIPFWDWMPTVAVHQYYCKTESGFWVYKTLDQWKKENPGVAETLVAQRSIQATPYGELQILDERFSIQTHRNKPIPLITTNIVERRLVDSKTGMILAKGIDVGSGVGNIATGGGVKFWLNQRPCVEQGIWQFAAEIQKLREVK